jgi:glycosyltransferase involved in cell wall biosynthesis
MNILVIHETEYIKKMVFEYQIIPELWASWGHNVYVVDFETDWRRTGFFNFRSKTLTIKNVRKADKKEGITLIRPGFIKLPIISRFSAAINHYFVIKKALVDKKIDVVFLYSVPTNGYQVIRLAKKFKIPVYFRLLDVLSQLVPYKILEHPTKYLEKYVYPKVDQLTAITPKLTRRAIEMGANAKTTSYLPSASDTDLFFPKAKDISLMKSLNIKKSDKIITFAGTLYNFSGLDKVLNYFAENIKRFGNLKFLIIGNGLQEMLLNKIVAENHIEDRVIMTGFIEYEQLGKYLNLADICICPFEINQITDTIFPGKIYQYLACEKPVLTSRLPGVIDIFPDNGGKNNIYYYNYKKPSDFFKVLESIKFKKIKNLEPSLQDIAKTIEGDLYRLIESRAKK